MRVFIYFTKKIYSSYIRLIHFFKRIFLRPSNSWLERLSPFSSVFGLDRGHAIDRKYIEQFIFFERNLIRGEILEVGDNYYSSLFGDKVTKTTVVGQGVDNECMVYRDIDLTIESTYNNLEKFDCIIATNVLNFIFDFELAVVGLARLTKTDGCCLVTVSGLSQISRYDSERWGDYWRFTNSSIGRVFDKYFSNVEIYTHGNAPLAAAMIMGLSVEDVPAKLFEYNDEDYQICITVKAYSPKVN